VAKQLRVPSAELGRLHELEEQAPRKNSRRTKGKRKDEVALVQLRLAVATFVCEVVAPHLAEEWERGADGEGGGGGGGGGEGALTSLAFQVQPALRVVPPSCKRVGQPHRDRDYGHQPGQINFWLPLSAASGSNTLWVERWCDPATTATAHTATAHTVIGHTAPAHTATAHIVTAHTATAHTATAHTATGHTTTAHTATAHTTTAHKTEDVDETGAGAGASAGVGVGAGAAGASACPLEGQWGMAHRFYANGCRHYTVPNSTNTTRVSLDLRVVPGPLFDNDWVGSRHHTTGRQAFFVGGYYGMATLDLASGTWCQLPPPPPARVL
jgi:hypothetical protein